MRKFVISIMALALLAAAARAETVFILHDTEQAPAAYAARKLGETLEAHGYRLSSHLAENNWRISLATNPHRLKPEAFAIIPEDGVITVYGGDVRGMVYGALSLRDQIRQGARLDAIEADEERPHLAFRGIKFNLPWDTYRPSSALDQHYETVRDLAFWEAFLDMLVENRFNVISLWNLHPYTYMVRPKQFPEASPWSDEALAEWQELYRGIFRLAKERGLDTYLVPWSVFVSRELAEAHSVAERNYYPHYYVEGDTSEIVRRYTRESVTQVLEEYPDLDGFGISHGEGMAGMTPLERQLWMDDVMIAGMLQADRPVKLIHRVPFSSGTSSDPGVSGDVEAVTRRAMERLGDQFDGPIWVEMKFNWSHAHSTPHLVKVHGGELGDTYFDPPPSNYKVTWMARNEDFFALRWGVPAFIREHIARNAVQDYVGGYFIGSDTYIPALDYFTAVDEPKEWTWAFERQWLYYQLWGRLLYDPATPDATFRDAFTRRYGPAGRNLLQALSLASSTQLRLASLYDARWDFTLYSEGFLALQGDYTRYISVDHLTEQPTMAPDYVAVADYVAERLDGGAHAVGEITPPILAAMLERDNREALRLVEDLESGDNLGLRYEIADIRIWAHLGLHLSEKLKGAVALHTFRHTGQAAEKEQAINHLEAALAHWDAVIRVSRPLYRDMPLTHYNHNFFDRNDDNRFHWALIREEVAHDVEIARAAVPFEP